MDRRGMDSISDTYQTLNHTRNNQFVIPHQPVGLGNTTQQNNQVSGGLCCTERSNSITLMCLGLLCTLLLACIVTQYVMYTVSEKGQIEKIQNLTSERNYIVKGLSEVDKEIREGWWYYNSSVYYISEKNERIKWTESRRYCKTRNADLVIINDFEEQKFIEKLTQNFNMDVWIGLSNRDHTGELMWVDGLSLSPRFRFWSATPTMIGENELCVQSTHLQITGKTWEARSCNCKFNFICEKKVF